MRKMRYLAAVAALCVGLLGGCGGGENRYTYRDAGIEALSAGDFEGAIVSFDQAIEASGGLVGAFDIDVLQYRAEAEYRAEDYQAAADTYGILLQADKELPEYYYMRCMARAQAGVYAGALEDYESGLALDTEGKAAGRAEALLAAGTAMEAQDRTAEAMSLYEQAEEAGLNSAGLYNRIGLCRMGEVDYEGAAAAFTKGLSAPDAQSLPELYYNQAAAYEKLGDYKKALELLNQYAAVNSSDETALREIEFLKTR